MTDNELLETLHNERIKFTKSDKALMQSYVDELVRRGVYPAESHGRPAMTMVDFWGVEWHVFKGLCSCPYCQADLRDHEEGAPFKREIAIIENDRASRFQCPDCGATWSREAQDGLRKLL